MCQRPQFEGDHTLELDADGSYRARDAAGGLLHVGSFELQPGNPPGTYYVDLLGDDGRSWALFEGLVADAPRKLLVVTSSDQTQLGVLSALPD